MKAILARVLCWLRRHPRPGSVRPVTRPEDDAGNTGLVLLNGDAAALAQKTVVVLGLQRGGTSMVAGALAHLGVPMGQMQSAFFEDPELSDCFVRGDRAAARAVVARRNARHDTWGFKKPRLDLMGARWQRMFRAPVYVVVFREPLATANRRAITYAADFFDNFDSVLRQQARLLAFARSTRRPCLLVSYEKALNDPAFFVHELARFLGCTGEDGLAAATAFVAPSPEAYRRTARVDTPRKGASGNWRGHLERAAPGEVAGWAFRDDGAQPATVELHVNGVLRARASADVSRQDVRDRFRLAGEGVGFLFRNGEQAGWEDGDVLSVRLAGEGADLNNSPQVCRA